MAAKKKSDSFFLRAEVTTSGATFVSSTIDLGAFVDALGQSVLRIHNIQTEIYNTGTAFNWSPSGEETLTWNLTTQNQSNVGLVNCTDKSLVASGSMFTSDDTNNLLQWQGEVANINPSQFTNGYLIATEQIYLGVGCASTVGTEADICIMMECTVEKLSKEAALALALSQQ